MNSKRRVNLNYLKLDFLSYLCNENNPEIMYEHGKHPVQIHIKSVYIANKIKYVNIYKCYKCA